ncbi:hypothetical protein BH20CHL6_BH20CHL6_03270 [soil metagenome]
MLGRFFKRLIDAQEGWARPVGDFNHRWLSALFRPMRPVKDFLNGTWLGHALHPALTDLPIGALSLAVLFDLLDLRPAADIALLFTLVAMVGAAAAGYADYTDTDGRPRVVATVHSTLMTVALALMVVSLLLRVGGPVDRTVPVVLGILALLIVTAGAYIGGEVVYALGNMVDRHAWRAGGRKWTALDVTDVPEGTPTRAMAGTEALVLVRYGSTVHAMNAICAHAGGPLDKGRVVDGCIECPWHQSRFRLTDGHHAQGPTTFDQPVYEVRRDEAGTGYEARRVG